VRPEAEAEYDRWLRDLLSRYGDAEAGLVIMLGNELEAPNHWNGSADVPADAAAYSALVARSAAVRDLVAPTVSIWRASTNFGYLFDDGPEDATVDKRLSKLLQTEHGDALLDVALEGMVAFDAFSLHPNYGAEGVLHQSRWIRERLAVDTPLVAEDMRSVRVDGIEARWPDEDGNGEADIIAEVSAGEPAAIATWRAAQVEELSQKLALSAAAGLSVACASTLFDFPHTYALSSWHNTGLMDDDGTPRPAFYAYQLWIEALQGWVPHVPFAEGEDGAWIVPFSRGEQRAVIAWGSGQWTPPADWGPIISVQSPPTDAGRIGWQTVDVDDSLTLDTLPMWIILSDAESGRHEMESR